ncbi:hypothetical protein ABEY63_25670 [Priestia aryabhattai]|uniref:hypothetical protein n=1 Tax=Priestia aryabhattai TaxID=412384 RepID=UPI003D2C5AC5
MAGLEREIDILLVKIEEDIRQFLIDSKTTKYPFFTGAYVLNAPVGRGLYFVWEHSEMVYVGETGSIRKRMLNIKNKNHSLYTKLKEDLFDPARNFRIAFYPIKLGRREMEDIFTSDIEAQRAGRPTPKYNELKGNIVWK